MLKEQVSDTELTEILKTEYGILFPPKRPLTVPDVTVESLKDKVKVRRVNTAMQNVRGLEKFLHMPAIGDGFGDDHHARVQQIGIIIARFGSSADSFIDQYAENNQLRLNVLTAFEMEIESLAEKIADRTLAEQVMGVHEHLFDTLEGKYTHMHYVDIISIDQKLAIVYESEDAGIDIMKQLT